MMNCRTGSENGHECDHGVNGYALESNSGINIPINLWHSGTTYESDAVYNIWKEAFDSINNNKSDRCDIDDDELISNESDTEINNNINNTEITVTDLSGNKCKRIIRHHKDDMITIEEYILLTQLKYEKMENWKERHLLLRRVAMNQINISCNFRVIDIKVKIKIIE